MGSLPQREDHAGRRRVLVRAAGAAAVAAVTAASGCSWVFVRAVPPRPPRPAEVRCTESRSAPVMDVVLGALAVGLGTAIAVPAMMASEANEMGDVGARVIVAAVGFGVVLAAVPLFGLSAAHGFRETARCRELYAEPSGSAALARDPPPQPVRR